MSVTVADTEFPNYHYDSRGDVLYLSVEGYDGREVPKHGHATEEGHGLEFDESGHVVAMTLVNVKWLIERDGELRITWPDGHVSHDTGTAVLAPAA